MTLSELDPESVRLVLDCVRARQYVAALVNVVHGYRDDEDMAVLDELASRLTALLPPEATPAAE